MSKLSNHLYLMSTRDDLTQLWAESFGLAADHYSVIFADEIRTEDGVCTLYRHIEREIIEHNISFLLIEIASPIYDPFLILDLKQKYDLTIALLAPDDEFKFLWISASYATLADVVLTTDYVSVNRYRQSGVDARFFHFPVYIPKEIPPRGEGDPRYDVSFVGVVDAVQKPSRSEWVRFLVENEIDISCLGGSWRGPSDPSYISRDKMYSTFRNSVINLNFSGISTYLEPDDPLFERIRTMKLRPFEIAAGGGFCMSEFSISLSRSLEDGVDIVFFRTKAELLEKIKYFLEHQDEAKEIAETGAQKVRQQFSAEAVARRLAKIIQEAQEHLGTDLYGEPHRVKVSRLLASSFMVSTLSNSGSLALKRKLASSFRDSWSCAKFLKSFLDEEGTLATLKVTVLVLYGLAKTPLSRVKSLIFSIAKKFSRMTEPAQAS